MIRPVTTRLRPLVVAGLWWLASLAASATTNLPPSLALGEVLHSVTNQYPPMLAALIERDIAAGRLRSAQGSFDFQFFTRLFGNPAGYYETGTVDAGFEQFTGIWGSTIYGGYRLTRGDVLPDYDKKRTQSEGEPRIGFRLPLLRDGSIDRRRAALYKARLDQELADPAIQRQQLDFIRAATVAYYGWLAAGRRWEFAEEIYRVARERGQALTNQVASGLVPRLVLTDNERLIVARSLGVIQARRRFEGAAIALSLFHHNSEDLPVLVPRERLPAETSELAVPEVGVQTRELELAMQRRPELRRLQLAIEKTRVDLRLARNQLLPSLDAGVLVADNLGDQPYKDLNETEVQAGVEFRLPLQRREAKGRVAEVEGQLEQLLNQERFARERIATEIQDARSALVAAHEQIQQARTNVFLARELQAAEQERFRQGATDLLAVQIREQAAFDAQVQEVDAWLEYFRAQADLEAATASSAPTAVRGR